MTIGPQSSAESFQDENDAQSPKSGQGNRPSGNDSASAKSADQNDPALKRLQEAVEKLAKDSASVFRQERARIDGSVPKSSFGPMVAPGHLQPLKEVQPGPRPDQTQMIKDAESIHRLITHEDSWLGFIQVADIKGVNRILQNKSEAERAAIRKIYRVEHGVDLENAITQAMPADYIQFRTLLDRKDGNIPSQNAGRILGALTELKSGDPLGRSRTMIEKDIRDTVSSMNAKQITEMDDEFMRLSTRYKTGNTKGLRETILSDRHLSDVTKSLLNLYLNGNDKRTEESGLLMTDIALREKNLQMFCEIMKDASGDVRRQFSKNNGIERLQNIFSGKDYDQAMDYLSRGDLSTWTQVNNNTGFMLTNEQGIEAAINNMPAHEQQQFLKGRALFLSGYKPHFQSRLDSELLGESSDINFRYYKNLHDTFSQASNPTNVIKWENMIAGDSFIPSLARHRGYIYNSPSSEIARDIESISEKDWQYGKQHPEQRIELQRMLASLNKSNSEIDQLLSVYDQKLAPQTYAIAKDISLRTVVDHINDHARSDNCPAIIAALETMTPAEQERYRTDADFHKNLDQLITQTLRDNSIINGQGIVVHSGHGDIYLTSARHLLSQIDQGKQPKEDILYKLQYLSTSADLSSANKALQIIERALKEDPNLQTKIGSPKTAEDKAYAENVIAAAGRAAPGYYESLIKPLLETGQAPLAVRLTLHGGLFNDDIESVCQDIIQHIPKDELKSFKDHPLSYADIIRIRYLNFLDHEQQKIVLAALKQGQMQPEDKIRASTIGWGGSSDIAEEIKNMKPEQLAACQKNYALKYGSSLEGDLWTKLSARDGDKTNRAFNKVLTVEEQANLARDEIQKTLQGLGYWLVNTVGRSATGQQALAANDRVVAELSNGNYQRAVAPIIQAMTNLPAGKVLELKGHMTALSQATKRAQEAADNHTASKETAAEYTAMAAMAAAGIATAGIESPLLFAFAAGLSGASANVITRMAVEGNNYDNSVANTAGHAGTGLVGGILSGLAPAKVAAALRISGIAAKEVAEATVADLVEALGSEVVANLVTPEAKQVLQKGAQSTLQIAVANGADQVKKPAIHSLRDSFMNAVRPANTPLDGDMLRLHHAVEKALEKRLQNKPTEVAHKFILHHGVNTIAGAGGGGASGAAEGMLNIDPNLPWDENTRQVILQTIGGTGAGATGALLISLAMQGASKTFKALSRTMPDTNEGRAARRTEATTEHTTASSHTEEGGLAGHDSGTTIPASAAAEAAEYVAQRTNIFKQAFRKGDGRLELAERITDSDLRIFRQYAEQENIQIKSIILRVKSDISEAGLAEIAKFTHLEELDLLVGPLINDRALAHLENLTKLKKLSIPASKVTNEGLKHLEKLSALETLDLSYARIVGDNLESLAALKNLKRLDLAGNKFTDGALEHLQGLAALKTLNLEHTLIGDAGLTSLPNGLKTLYIGGTQITGAGLKNLERLPELTYLSLSQLPVHSDDLQHLAGLTKLIDLDLSRTFIGKDSLQHLKVLSSLESLDLNHTAITDSELQHLAALKNLEALYLDTTWITGNGLANLKDLSNLKILNLRNTGVNDDGLAHLQWLTELDDLNLEYTRVTGPGLVHLTKLQKLTGLNLSYTLVGDSHLDSLANITSLKGLIAENTHITQAGIDKAWADKAVRPKITSSYVGPPPNPLLGDGGTGGNANDSNHGPTDDPDKPGGPPSPHSDQPASGGGPAAGTAGDTSNGNAADHNGAARSAPPEQPPLDDGPFPSDTHTPDLSKSGDKPSLLVLMKEEIIKRKGRLSFETITDEEMATIVQLKDDIKALRIGDVSKLSATASKSLGQLHNLEKLELMASGVNDEFLANLKNLKKLTHLDISSTRVTGNGLEHLKELKALEYLELSHNDLIDDDGLAHLSRLTKLKYLNLGCEENYLISDAGCVHLKDLTELKQLDLAGTRVTDAGLSSLNNMDNLSNLSLNRTKVTGIGLSYLKNPEALQALHMKECQVNNNSLAALEKMTNLNTLSLKNNANISDSGLKHLKGLKAMRELDLSSNKNITDSGLKHLEGLNKMKILYLDRTGIKGTALDKLQAMTQLQWLHLSGTGINTEGLARLPDLPNLVQLSVAGTLIDNDGLTHFSTNKLPKLKTLMIQNTKVTEAGINKAKKNMNPNITIFDGF